MARQQQRRHAQPIAPYVQQPACQTGERAAAARVRRHQGAQKQRVHQRQQGCIRRGRPQRGAHGRRHRRFQHARAVAQRIQQWPAQLQFVRARRQKFPETRRGPEVQQQPVQVEQVAQALVEFPVIKQVRGAVQHHVDRRQHLHCTLPCQRNGGGAQFGRVRPRARRQRQNRVVHVDHAGALHVPHGRNFMHPEPVVALVVGILVLRKPAGQHQRRFHQVDVFPPHQNVDVRKQPPLRRRQVRHHISGPLEQQQRHLDGGQRRADPVHFPAHALPVPLDQRTGPGQVAARCGRDGVQQPMLQRQAVQRGRQVGRQRLAQQQVPLGQRQVRHATWRAQHRHQQRRGHHRAHAASAARRAKVSMASSRLA